MRPAKCGKLAGIVISALKNSLHVPVCDLPKAARWWVIGVLLTYTLAGIVALDLWQKRGGQSVTQLGFGYGVLIEAIEKTGEYRVAEGIHYPGVAFSAHRLPFIPYFIIALKDVLGDDLRRVALAKCLLFNSLLIFTVLAVFRRAHVPLWSVLLLLGFVLTMPRWNLNVFEVGLEEGYNVVALGLLFAWLWFTKRETRAGVPWALATGLLLVLLLFLKNSMLYWCLAAPVLVAFRDRTVRPPAVMLALVVAGLLGLMLFNGKHAGRYTVGSSWEGWNLYKGNSEYSKELYPPYSLDILDYEDKVVAHRFLRDEWDHSEYFKQRAVNWVKANPREFVELAIRKAWIFYGEVRASGLSRGESRYGKPMYVAQVPWMIAFRVLLWAAILLALQTLWRAPWRSDATAVAITFLGFLVLYSGFHVVGFAYERHVMPIVLPTVLYLLWCWSENVRQAGIKKGA